MLLDSLPVGLISCQVQVDMRPMIIIGPILNHKASFVYSYDSLTSNVNVNNTHLSTPLGV